MIPAGTRIADRYTVTGDIGAGGMGIVVRARDDKLGRTIAIKVLPADAIGDDTARRRLVREARAAAALDHRGIVHIYDVGEMSDGSTYIVMELVRGESLATHIQHGTLSRADRLTAVVHIARALGYAHAEGFVHRDIKPDNIMIRQDGGPVILDFGLAKAYSAELASTMEAVTVTAKGGFVGTPAYVSPEQARGEEVDPATDQFALAVTTFELMTGKLPWEGTTPIEVMSEILKGVPASLRDSGLDLPPGLDVALERAFSKKKADRFPTIDAFGDALAACIPDMGGVMPPASLPRISGPISSDDPMVEARSAVSATKVSGSGGERIAISATKVSTTTGPRKRSLVAGIVATGAVIIGASIFIGTRPKKIEVAPSPLATIVSKESWVLACPQMVAHDEDPESGWLGAATASLFCQRAQVLLGGHSSRTLIPAELLDLPPLPRDDYPKKVFEAPGLREKQIARATEHADVWIDGVIESKTDFHLTVILRDAKNVELARAEGTDKTLIGVIRMAMNSLRAASVFPPVRGSLFEMTNPGASADAALEIHDLNVANLEEDADDITATCDRLDKRNDVGVVQPLVATICAQKRNRPLAPLTIDESSIYALAATSLAMALRGVSNPAEQQAQQARIDKLESEASKATDPDVRAILYAAAAEIAYYSSPGTPRAAVLSRKSLQEAPKEADIRGSARHRLSFTSPDATIAHAAWYPWEAYAQGNLEDRLMRSGVINDESLKGFRRAALLGKHGFWARNFGDAAVQLNHLETARSVAVELHNDDYLNLLIMHGELRLGAAVDFVGNYVTTTNDPGSIAPLIVSIGMTIATTLGRPTDFAITYLDRFVYKDPPTLSHGVVPFYSVMSMCMLLGKTNGTRCIDRLSELFHGGYFGAAQGSQTNDVLSATRYYLQGDYTASAKQLRQIQVRQLANFGASLTAIIDSLERGGEGDIAEKFDKFLVDNPNFHPAYDDCFYRQAVRAEKHRDFATARKLAQEYVNRWEAADERPKHVPDAKKLLARLPPP